MLPKYKRLGRLLPADPGKLENEGDRVYRRAVAELFGGDTRRWTS